MYATTPGSKCSATSFAFRHTLARGYKPLELFHQRVQFGVVGHHLTDRAIAVPMDTDVLPWTEVVDRRPAGHVSNSDQFRNRNVRASEPPTLTAVTWWACQSLTRKSNSRLPSIGERGRAPA